jgi:RimJ/RimL family protein N-acetyltransferase
MTIPEEIQTDRLHLRWHVEADAEEIFARYAHDPEVTRYLCWKPHQTLDDTLTFQREKAADRDQGVGFGWLIRSRESRLVLGMVGFKIDKHTADLGYCLARDAWGQGYATEAARAVISTMRQHGSEIWRIEALCHVANKASARVLEKAGLRHEGILRRYYVFPNLGDEPQDVHCYALARDAAGMWR